MPCEDEGRDWSDASTSKGMTKIAANQELREAWGRFCSHPSEEPNPAKTLISDFSQRIMKQISVTEICFWYFLKAALPNLYDFIFLFMEESWHTKDRTRNV